MSIRGGDVYMTCIACFQAVTISGTITSHKDPSVTGCCFNLHVGQVDSQFGAPEVSNFQLQGGAEFSGMFNDNWKSDWKKGHLKISMAIFEDSDIGQTHLYTMIDV